MAGRCELTDLVANSCSHCTGRTGDAELLAALAGEDADVDGDNEWGRPLSREDTPWFQARYRGGCADCKSRIAPGDWIRPLPGDAPGFLCRACGSTSEDDP
jgi:hypothetical protein